MTIEEYKQMLDSHDWNYEMSDDYRVYKNAKSNFEQIKTLSQTSNEFRALYLTYYNKHYNNEPRI